MLRIFQLILLGLFTFVVIMVAGFEDSPKLRAYPIRKIAGFIFLLVSFFIYSRRDSLKLIFDRNTDSWRLDTKNWWKQETLLSERIGDDLKIDIDQQRESFQRASMIWNIIVVHRGQRKFSKETIAYGDSHKANQVKKMIEEYLQPDTNGEPLIITGKESSMIAVYSYGLLGLIFLLI